MGVNERASGLRAAVAVASGLAVTVGVLALLPAGPIAADSTEHVEATSVIGPLGRGVEVLQRFEASADGLSTVAMRLGTYGGASRCSLRAVLRRETRQVASAVRPCASIPNNGMAAVLSFPPIADSGGRDFELVVSVDRPGEPIAVWAGDAGDSGHPPAVVDGVPQATTVDLQTGYGGTGRAGADLDVALRRIGVGSPPWQGPGPVSAAAIVALACLVALTVARRRALTLVVVLLVVAKGFVWAAVLPAFEGPDEPAHVAYAQFLAEAHRIPKRGVAQLDLPNAYSDQLVRSVADRHTFAPAPGDRVDADPRLRDHRDASAAANGNGSASFYPPHFYVVPAALYELVPGRIDEKAQAMRLWSVALGGVAAWLTLLAGRRILVSEAAAVALAVAVAFQPMASQQTAVVNGDALVIAGGALCLLAATEVMKPERQRHPLATLAGGVAVGAAAVAKLFALAFAPVLLGAWLAGRRRSAPSDRSPVGREAALAGAGFGLSFGSWWAYAAAFGHRTQSVQDTPAGNGPTGLLDFVHLHRLEFRRLWIEQLWGNFSWLDTPLPTGVLDVVGIAVAAAVCSVAAWVVATVWRAWRGRRSEARLQGDIAPVVLCIGVIVASFGILYTTSYMQFRHSASLELVQGRYALMALPALMAAPALCIGGLGSPGRRSRVVTTVMVAIAAGVVALNLGSVALLLDRFYL